jgi:hypothetical protein
MASEDGDGGNCEGEKCIDDLTKGLDHVTGLLASIGGGASGLGLGNLQAVGEELAVGSVIRAELHPAWEGAKMKGIDGSWAELILVVFGQCYEEVVTFL